MPSIEDYDYELPESQIAQEPLPGRTSSRLMVVDRARDTVTEARFADLPDYLRGGDLLVRNNTRVIPALVDGARVSDGSTFTAMFYQEVAPGLWKALCKPAKKVKHGTTVRIGGQADAEVREIPADALATMLPGERWLQFAPGTDLHAVLDRAGRMPLPPYVKTFQGTADRYQTTYAKNAGAVAAPTAGFHFTPELFAELAGRGVGVAEVTLHVGPGTFQPVRHSDYTTHRMLPERYVIEADASRAVADAKAQGRRVIAIGSTSMRVVETAARDGLLGQAASGWTDLYCTPGYAFRAIDAMITNFHLPRTTLLLLVMAFGGEALMKRAYAQAVASGFRFYSFGDAMLIL